MKPLFLKRRRAPLALLALCACAVVIPSSVSSMGRQLALGAVGAPATSIGAASPEKRLVKALLAIRENHLSAALAEIDGLLETYPNFRLAQLIRGDLLLARAKPIRAMGDADQAPADRLNDLRAEARARLVRHQREVPRGMVPKYLLKLQARQRNAIVVDTAKSTLYLFENHDGEARYVADYYISVGKNGSDKAREGDKRTPLGVYHVAAELPTRRLGALYGIGAFPLNYPNEWDERQGRKGHGIWLHGVPRDTYSRPPRASDGCVVLTNQDLDAVSKHLQIGLTPVIIADGVEWVPPAQSAQRQEALSRELENWRQSWENRDTDGYLRFYARNFSSGDQNLEQWGGQKRRVNASKTWIKVHLTEVSMFLYPGRDDLAVVDFMQDYSSNNLGNKMRKRQYWARDGAGWKILYEGSA